MPSSPSPDAGFVSAAIVSTDATFHQGLTQSLNGKAERFRIDVCITEPFTAIADLHLDRLREAAPDVIFVDLESDPQVGLKFAEYLLESKLTRSVVAAGPADSPDLLLSAMRAGVVEFIPKPLDIEQVRGTLDRIWKRAGKAGTAPATEEKRAGQTLCVFSGKGGSGSTTFAVNLAVEIHRTTRQRTLLVDLDLELGDTALLLGMEPRFSFVDLIRNFHRVDAGLLASYIERHSSGVDLLAAPLKPAGFEDVEPEQVAQIFAFLKQHYDYIVVDAPKSLNSVTRAAIQAADNVLVLVTPDLPSVRNAARCLPLLDQLERPGRSDWIQVVANRISPRQLISLGDIRKTLNRDVVATLRNDYQSTMDAINEGRPAVLDRNSIFAKDVRDLASRITGVQVADRDGGFLSGLFGRSR